MNIALDMMGGDHAPLEVVKGISLFLAEAGNNTTLTLIGDEAVLVDLLATHAIPLHNINLVHASEQVEMHEHPTRALRQKPQSSIAIGFQMLAAGDTDAFISAGNTGAMLVGALFSIKAIDGVSRPTIGAYIPRENGTLGLLVDAGINADCKPENLNQFATLGSLYAEHILGYQNPKTGLINMGEEEGKGNLLAQAAYPLLKENKHINFVGNIEGRDILLDKADVMVCEGFTGNVVLKMAESLYDLVKRRGIQDDHLDRFDFEIYGGIPVLGVAKPVIIGHGISHAVAFKNMILIAKKMIEKEFMQKMREVFTAQSTS